MQLQGRSTPEDQAWVPNRHHVIFPVPSDLQKHLFGFQLRARWKLSQSHPAPCQGLYAGSSNVNYPYIPAVGSKGDYPAPLPIVKVSGSAYVVFSFQNPPNRVTACSSEFVSARQVSRLFAYLGGIAFYTLGPKA
jgi:hypothetical protein